MKQKYINNQGDEIEADYGELPVANNKGNGMYEELWRRIQHIESIAAGGMVKEQLQSILMDIEYWLSIDPILSPLRWSISQREWRDEKEARIKKRRQLEHLINSGDKVGIANFYRKNGVWYSTEKVADG